MDEALPRPRRSAWLALLLLAGVVGVLLIVSPLIGPVPIDPRVVIEIVLNHATGEVLFPNPCEGAGVSVSLCNAYGEIVWEARLPEVLLAVLAGSALGMAGGTLQGVFRNPLADPFLLGLSSGGTLGAATVLIFHVGEAEASLFLPLFAFFGASATGLVLLLVARGRFGSVETLLLTGVALANLLSAVLALFLLYNPVASQQVDFWLLGGLGEASWTGDGIALGVILIAGSLLTTMGRELNLMQLGNDVAQTAGVDARRVAGPPAPALVPRDRGGRRLHGDHRVRRTRQPARRPAPRRLRLSDRPSGGGRDRRALPPRRPRPLSHRVPDLGAPARYLHGVRGRPVLPLPALSPAHDDHDGELRMPESESPPPSSSAHARPPATARGRPPRRRPSDQAGGVRGPRGSEWVGQDDASRVALGLLPDRQARFGSSGTAISDLSIVDRARRVAWVPQSEDPRDNVRLLDYVLYGRYAHHSALEG